MGLKKLVND